MKTSEIRQAFLQYFANEQHTIVPSSPLIPANDPTLLFTNAGMVQFKECFLGLEQRDYNRATSSQRCVRAGGKHNDLENVGYTARHHTFFEMLGNFSFGDYFKREAIKFAWDFLTKVLDLPAEKLWVTVFRDDDEAADIWLKEMGVDPNRFSRCDEADNFWSMGDTGPCGPCSEIFYDHGPSIAGGPPGSPDADGDRYVEIWNLVFMQFERAADGSMTPLPKPSVDTGMGLERIAAVMQNVHNNYDIDLFSRLIRAAAEVIGTRELQHPSMKVIADHIRSCTFLIIDGVVPSNEGRGYVLRRIMRRAIRHGHKMGCDELFFAKLVAPLVAEMGEAYPELVQAQSRIEKIILNEEEQFARTLAQGLRILEQDFEKMQGDEIPGATVFKLYDTYGFPVDLTADIARERGLQLDMEGFDAAMEKQRSDSRAASQFGVDYTEQLKLDVESTFSGYDHIVDEGEIKFIIRDGDTVASLKEGERGALILHKTPFYAESGGQVGDKGEIIANDGRFRVVDTQKMGSAIVHYGEMIAGVCEVNDKVMAQVDKTERNATRLNHSATHLLHAALRNVLGDHVMQKGSLVDASRLRFDFTHPEPVKPEQLRTIEYMVNQQIRANHPVTTAIMTPEEAQQAGAMALFGEKYGEQVRVLTMGEFSKELCGGTHVSRTGDIGYCKIVSETGIAAGIRRIEAVTGEAAVGWALSLEHQWQDLATVTKASSDKIPEKISQLIEQNKQLNKEVERLQAKLATSVGGDLTQQAQRVGDVNVLVTQLPGADMKTLRNTMDQLKNKLGESVVVLVGVIDNKISVVAGLSKSLIGKVPPPKDYVAAICGRGGGRDDMAQGGGECPADLTERLQHVMQMISEQG